MKLHKLFGFVGVILVITIFACSEEGKENKAQQKYNFKPGSEPEGFRDIKWGTHLSRIEGMEKYGELGRDDLQLYVRRGDEREIGGVIADRIQYRFWKGKFYAADVFIGGVTFWDVFRRSVFERYGEVEISESADKKREDCFWHGRKTAILLTYKRDIYETHLFISSEDIEKEMIISNSPGERKKGF